MALMVYTYNSAAVILVAQRKVRTIAIILSFAILI